MWLLPANYLSILTIIWIAIFNYYFSLKITFIALFASLLGFYLIFTIHWQQTNIMMTTLLYGTFHVFAILMSHQTRLAEIASEKAEKLNQELQATQYLLAEASKQNERTRIARDLHDLLGHHLTALLINLQVASRITEGEVKTSIETCHSIAKLLMSDVREAVSSLRENETIDLKTMITMMAEYIPTLSVQTEIDNELSIENLAIAKCVLSCVQESITNTAKHSDATTLDIHIHQKVNNIVIELIDNGTQARVIQVGNGLTGMQERLKEHSGTMAFHCEPNMQIKILLPLS
jgi:signal transduction histidine kinase